MRLKVKGNRRPKRSQRRRSSQGSATTAGSRDISNHTASSRPTRVRLQLRVRLRVHASACAPTSPTSRSRWPRCHWISSSYEGIYWTTCAFHTRHVVRTSVRSVAVAVSMSAACPSVWIKALISQRGRRLCAQMLLLRSPRRVVVVLSTLVLVI